MRIPTFSQSHGIEPLPEPLRLGRINQRARNLFWDVLWTRTQHRMGRAGLTDFLVFGPPWNEIFSSLHRDYWERPADELPQAPEMLREYKRFFLQAPFNRCFDVLQMMMQHPACPPDLVTAIQGVFDDCHLAYRIDTTSTPRILPAATEQEGDALIGALQDLEGAGLGGAATHLRQAGERIREADWAGSIRESLHAVESVATRVAPDDADTLGKALSVLERQADLHGALKKGFAALYGYASDEDGIRHSLSGAESKATQDEAIFMIGACAAFCSYLWRKFGSENAASRLESH